MPNLPKISSAMICVALSACAGNYTTRGAAVDYNRAFADARNELILLNILRASARQPLQFSLISQVNGAVQNSTSVKIPFTNVIAGGADAISPEITVGTRNPGVTVTPLDSREFVRGMLQPVSVETFDNLIAQGWSRSTVLSLVVGGVECAPNRDGSENVQLNSGPSGPIDAAMRRAFANSSGFTASGRADREIRTIRLPTADALKLLREGVGEGRQVRLADPKRRAATPVPDDQLELSIVETGSPMVEGLSFASIPSCTPTLDQHGHSSWGLITRSVYSMFRYVGQEHANTLGDCDRGGKEEGEPAERLFQVRVMCAGMSAPVTAAVATEFEGRTYYIPRTHLRSLQVLELLATLTSLQTSENAVAASRPIIAVTTQ